MKKEIEISAKTKEEAIARAVEQLGAPNEAALVITVLHEGRKGFLGFGAVDAVIKAVYQVPETPSEEKFRRDRGGRSGRRESGRDGSRDGNRAHRRNQTSAEQGSDTAAETPAESAEPASAPETGTPAKSARKPAIPIDPAEVSESERMAYRFITTLVENMGLEDVKIAMHPGDNDDMVITVDGDAAGVLIGHHGDTLDALQYLANLAANRKEEGEKREYARITVDVESYRSKREDALRILARKKANQVLKYKKSIMLEPMNPYERRIIHSEIQYIAGVTTNSIGVENNRRIVIYLEEEGMPTAGLKSSVQGGTDEKLSRSRNRRCRLGRTGALSNPLALSSNRQSVPSAFDEDDVKDPFDIDLSAATYSEEDEAETVKTTEAVERKSDIFDVPSLDLDEE